MKTRVLVIATLASVLGLISFSFGRNPETVLMVKNTSYDYARGVFAGVGHKVYIALGEDSLLQIVDVSDIANPSDLGSENVKGVAEDVCVQDSTYAYVAAGTYGLSIVNVSDASDPDWISQYDTPGCAYGVFYTNNTAYVADGTSGLRIINVTDRSNPAELGYYNTSGTACDVYVVDTLAYVADETGGLRIISVNDPANPFEVGSYDTPGYTTGVYVQDDYAYIADWGTNKGLRTIDVSDPTNPAFEDRLADIAAVDVYVYGYYAYVADQNYGYLRMVDVSDPGAIDETDDYNVANSYSFGVHGTASCYIYLVNDTGGLYNFIAKGDVNEDSTIDIDDVTRICNIILGNPPDPTAFEEWASDANDDSDINVLDNVKLANVITGVETDPEITEPAELWLARVQGPMGGYNVILENDLDVAGVQISISYNPHAMQPGIPQTTERSEGLDLHYVIRSDEIVILLNSITVEAISSGTGPIVQIPLENPGKGSAHITDALLATIDAQDYPVIIRRIGLPKVANQQLPTTYSLSQNYPNPFNPETTIEFAVPEACKVKVQVYNLLGQEVEMLIDSEQEAGHYEIKWNASDVASGVYFYRLTAGEFSESRRMVLMK